MARSNLWRSALPALAAALVANTAAMRAWADDEIDREPQSCVLVKVIRNAQAADDHTLVFFMKGSAIYRNNLPVTCPPLKPGETQITYLYRGGGSVKLQRLCDYDGFSVTRDKIASPCRLGQFNPITAAEADALLGPTTPDAAGHAAAEEPAAAKAPAGDSSEDTGKSKRRKRE
jgi:hypothetical protein